MIFPWFSVFFPKHFKIKSKNVFSYDIFFFGWKMICQEILFMLLAYFKLQESTLCDSEEILKKNERKLDFVLTKVYKSLERASFFGGSLPDCWKKTLNLTKDVFVFDPIISWEFFNFPFKKSFDFSFEGFQSLLHNVTVESIWEINWVPLSNFLCEFREN